MLEQTLVLIKPDAVKRNLIGEIILRYEREGLKVIKIKMLQASAEIVEKHYPSDEEYLISLGKKSAAAGEQVTDFYNQGKKIVENLRNFITSSPAVALILEGENVITKVRRVTGYTDPASAEKGTIRGDLGQDSILQANREERPVYNLVHASGNLEEAKKEIKLWFGGN